MLIGEGASPAMLQPPRRARQSCSRTVKFPRSVEDRLRRRVRVMVVQAKRKRGGPRVHVHQTLSQTVQRVQFTKPNRR